MDNGFGMLCQFQSEPLDLYGTSEESQLTFQLTGNNALKAWFGLDTKDVIGDFYMEPETKECWRKLEDLGVPYDRCMNMKKLTGYRIEAARKELQDLKKSARILESLTE